MKDFVKWLGVNEKVAKVVVWILIIMITLIIFNTAMESLGFPYYAITYDNLIKIKTSKLLDIIVSCIVVILNFYSIVLLVFRVKESKKIFKYALLYMILNWIIKEIFGLVAVEIFIPIYCAIFSYIYSKKNKKYILYGILALIINTVVQGIWYLAKAKFIDYPTQTDPTKIILSLDFFIIMGIIILVKEIYLKKRGEKICGEDLNAGFGSVNSKTKTNSQKNLQRKSQVQSNKSKRIK